MKRRIKVSTKSGKSRFIIISGLLALCFIFYPPGTRLNSQELGAKTPEGAMPSKLENPFLNPQNRRDPFKPFIKIIREPEAKPALSELVPPIKKYPLQEFRLVGIIWVGKEPKAMVVDPERNTYVLGIGDEIGNSQGRIVEIRENGIMVEEKRYFEDIFGERKVEVKRSVLAFKEE